METVQNNKVNLVQKLNTSHPSQIATLPEVADRFRNIYAVMNGGNSTVANMKYEAEKFHFNKLLQDKPELQQCTKLSLYGCFLDMAVNGLSFDPSMKHAYVVSFNVNAGTKQSPKWEKRASLMISGYGELHMRVRQGQVKYADNPVLVYEGDLFSYGTENNKLVLTHKAVIPRKSDNIIACYLRIERNDASVDYKVFSIDEVLKLKAFSKQPDSLAWNNGLPGMIQAKTIKHAFRSYPKMRMGEFSTLQSHVVDQEIEGVPAIDYGLDEDSQTLPEPPQNGASQPAIVVSTVQQQSPDDFETNPNQKQSTGTTVQIDGNEDDWA